MAAGKPIQVSVTVKRSVIEKIPDAMKAEAERIMSAAAREGEIVAKRAAPVRTGFLKNSISVERGELNRTLHSKANYSAYVNYGTKYMGARPYFTEGAEAMNKAFLNGWNGTEGRLPRID